MRILKDSLRSIFKKEYSKIDRKSNNKNTRMRVDLLLKINSSGNRVRLRAKLLKSIKKMIILYMKEELNNTEILQAKISIC